MNENVLGQVLDTVSAMERERREAHRVPSHVLFRDLCARAVCDDNTLREALRTLYKQRRIRVGATINDWYISTKTEV